MHNVEYFTYPLNVSKRNVQKELDNYAAHEDWQEGCTGLYRDIRWLDDKTYESYEAATEAIRRLDRNNYDQLAVKYKHNESFVDAKLKELENVSRSAWDELKARANKLYPSTLASVFIGCKNCGSRLSTKHLRRNDCPVCGHDLRPEYILKSISAARAKFNRADDKRKEYISKHSKKTVMWLVKIEYHT